MQLIVDGLATHYISLGSGPILLFLHGWGDKADSFQPLINELSTNYHCIAPDLPGFGASETPPDNWTLDLYADFVGKFLAKAGTPNVEAIIGHSNGGAIAIRGLAAGQLASQYLVLLASSGIRGEFRPANQLVRSTAKAAKTASRLLGKNRQAKLKKSAYRWLGSDMFVAEKLTNTFKNIVSDDVRSSARQIKLPTLLIYGSEDKATPVNFARQFNQAIAGSRLEVIPDTGHFIHQEAPARVIQLIKEFVE